MNARPEEIAKEVEVRQSNKHSLCMHNAIAKLKNKPLSHVKGRKGIEKSILHLHEVHHVQIADSLVDMLLSAYPSQSLLESLFRP
ncbi:MAG: hypothetical protein PHW24_03465 [Candidatus Moranbacteria bacterium]|jgi:hypothetical protein|nr:hypothetical protein [Candidatus Moranbacteria bacterium]